MRLDSFFQLCFHFCLAIIIFTLAVNFITSLNVFTNTDETGYSGNTSSAQRILEDISGFEGGFASLWAVVVSAGAILSVGVSYLTKNQNILPVYIFSSIIWTSYNRFITTININNWIPTNFMIIITFGILFIYIGALISILSGGQQ